MKLNSSSNGKPWHSSRFARGRGTLLSLLGLGSLATLLMPRLKRQFTQLDETRRSLEISRERFALAVAGSDAGIWDWDIPGDRVVASQRAFEIFGLPSGPESRTRDEWLAELQIHPGDVAAHRQAFRAHLDGETAACFSEFRVRQGDGAYRWVRVRGQCVRDAAGKALRMAGSVADIDAQRRVEDALRVSEERFALAVAGSDDGLWDWDYRSGIAFESRRARELQGLPLQPEAQPLQLYGDGKP
jgi:PAS domain S-box-containing protein